MRHIIIKKNLIAASALLLSGYIGSAEAHDQTGSLGKAASATDHYLVSCYDDGNGPADHLFLQIRDERPVAKPLISVQVTNGLLSSNSTDAVDGDATYSPGLNIRGGNIQDYSLTIDKTAAGAETYTLEYHCLTSSGDHTGTNIQIITNQ